MTYSVSHDTISIYLTEADRQQAQDLAKQSLSPDQGAQIYRNTLAVLATRQYLNMLDIPSDLEKSHSFNPVVRLFDDVADLYIPEARGRLECRPMNMGERTCYMPESVHEGRMGYMAVELNNDHTKAIIKGFIQEVLVEQLPVSYLQPLDTLFDYLAPISVLSNWIDGIIGTEWLSWQDVSPTPMYAFKELQEPLEADALETDDELRRDIINLYRADSGTRSLPTEQAEFSPIETLATLVEHAQDDRIRWDAAELLHQVAPNHPLVETIRAKDLGLYLDGQTVALLVGIIQKADGKALIGSRVYPIGDLSLLPHGLKLSGVTPDGETFFEVQARTNDDYIQFLFTADENDEFMLRVEFETASVTENFRI